MAGAQILVSFDDREAQRFFNVLVSVGQNMLPVARAIGVGLVRNTQDRFRAGRDPDGAAWAPLRPATIEMKRGPGILRESAMRGGLMASITFRAEGSFANASVQVGTNKIYGAIHQFGGTIRPKNPRGLLLFRDGRGNVWGAARSVTIPARPYLGISREDRTMIGDVLWTFIRRRAGVRG
jgi:phage virion morphogenesis protein